MIPIGTHKVVATAAVAVHSPAWMGDSKRLLFADRNNIFQWEPNKTAVTIYAAEGLVGGLSLGPKRPDGTQQVVVAHRAGDSDIWEIPLDASGTKAAGAPRALIRSTASESQPDLSPDGLHIAFSSNRGGTGEIWVADADGENARQVTPPGVLGASYPKWSPDSKQIAFHAAVPDVSQVFVVDANHGTPRQVTHENPGMAVVSWSRDGRFLYARTHTDGVTIYRLPAAGGPKEHLWEGSMQKESLDGKRLFYSKLDTPGIFFRSLEGDLTKDREELLVPDYWSRTQIGGFTPTVRGVYFVGVDEKGRPSPFRFFDFATGESKNVAPAVPGLGVGLSVSPDRRRLVFTASAESGGDLLSLELH